MALKFFVVAVRSLENDEVAVNDFLRVHRVVAIDRKWLDRGADSCWMLCVEYVDSEAVRGRPANAAGRGRVDYREALTPDQFACFARLRELRKATAQAEGVPVYTVFTNEQLAEMVRNRAATKADLERIAGVGDARVAKYGSVFLEQLSSMWSSDSAANGAFV